MIGPLYANTALKNQHNKKKQNAEGCEEGISIKYDKEGYSSQSIGRQTITDFEIIVKCLFKKE